jgi:hypothetical protein
VSECRVSLEAEEAFGSSSCSSICIDLWGMRETSTSTHSTKVMHSHPYR